MLVFHICQDDWAQEPVYLFAHFEIDQDESGRQLVYMFEWKLLHSQVSVSKLLPDERSKVMYVFDLLLTFSPARLQPVTIKLQ